MEDLMKIIKSLEESGLMLLGKLAASIFGNTLPEQGVIRAGERTVIAGQTF